MLSATGTLNSSTSLELSWGRAANSLNYQLQQQQLFRANAGVSSLPLLFPSAVQADYVPVFLLPRRAHGQRRPVPNRSGPVHQPEHHARHHRQPDESVGSAFLEGRVLLPAQLQAAEHLRRFNSQIDFQDNASNPSTRGSATRTRRRACSISTSKPISSRFPSGTTRTSSGTRRTTGSPAPFDARLRRAVLHS
jgi:hypothetical protein